MRRIWNRKNRAWAVFAVLAIGLVLSVFVFNSSRVVREDRVVKENFIAEAQVRRKSNSAATIDISDIVNKYMKTGATQKSAEDYLTGLGFKIAFSQFSSENSKRLHIKYVRPLLDKASIVGFDDEIQVLVIVENGVTEELRGGIMQKAL